MGVWDERGIATDNAATDATAPNEASDNASTISAPPYMPNALPLSSNSAQLAARLYPMISNVLPNPAAMRPGVAGAVGEAPLPTCIACIYYPALEC